MNRTAYLAEAGLADVEWRVYAGNTAVSATDLAIDMPIDEGSGGTTREAAQDVAGAITGATWSTDHP